MPKNLRFGGGNHLIRHGAGFLHPLPPLIWVPLREMPRCKTARTPSRSTKSALAGACFRLTDGAPNLIGRRRHRNVADAKLTQGVEDGADHAGRRRRGAA